MREFIDGHRCNAICRHLSLPEVVSTAATTAVAPVHGIRTTTMQRVSMPMAFCGLAIAEESDADY